VVVDNDAAASAEPVAARWRAAGMALRYEVQPGPNISLTRNRTVAGARGSWLAFIDDDEAASPDWLAQLLAAAEAYHADVVFGPVWPDFAAPAPAWVTSSAYFQRRYPATGEPMETGGCGNALVRAELLAGRPGPFDPALGRSGGEDTFLFDQLRRDGARLVMCREAEAREHVPADRLRLGWLVRRAYRTGGLYAARTVALSDRPARARARLYARAGAVALLSAGRAAASRRATGRADHALRAVSGLGQLAGLAGRRVAGYGTPVARPGRAGRPGPATSAAAFSPGAAATAGASSAPRSAASPPPPGTRSTR
jgi:succinoglycan biosynthesis protein ExoM